MRRFLSLRYVLTSNVPFEKNKMASTLAASVITTWSVHKCKEAERRVKFKGNRKRSGEKTEKVKPVFLGKLPAGKVFCKYHTITRRREIKSRMNCRMKVRSLSILRNAFLYETRINMVAAIRTCFHTTHDWIWLVAHFGFSGPL